MQTITASASEATGAASDSGAKLMTSPTGRDGIERGPDLAVVTPFAQWGQPQAIIGSYFNGNCTFLVNFALARMSYPDHEAAEEVANPGHREDSLL